MLKGEEERRQHGNLKALSRGCMHVNKLGGPPSGLIKSTHMSLCRHHMMMQ